MSAATGMAGRSQPSPAHGGATPPAAPHPGVGPHRLALVTVAATVLLIFVGGVVTNTGSGLAVPDWPTTFGYNMFLYPWSQMVGGIFYEHSHRLLGSAVGMLTVALALWLWFAEPRTWLRVLALLAVVGVVVQGVLGGLRVVLLQHELAILHGCLAHAFLGLLVTLAVCTSPGWHRAPQTPRLADAARLRTAALLTAGLVYVQIVFGAVLTHTGTRLDVHLLVAGLVVLSVCLLARRVLRWHAERAPLRRPAVLLLVLLVVQLGLGLGAYLARFTSAREALSVFVGLALPTTHRVVGAALLATSVVLAARVLRLSGAPRSALQPATAPARLLSVDVAENQRRGAVA